jgi:serine/threonine protein kinase
MVKVGTSSNFSLIQQEIVLLKECSHPNIISYFGSYFHKDSLAIVMEYCSGGSLHDIYKMTGALNELQIAFVCRETLKGLQYLNSKNQVHRDVKAPNILLTNTGDIKLAGRFSLFLVTNFIDFGIAAQISATIGKCKSFIGTPYW